MSIEKVAGAVIAAQIVYAVVTVQNTSTPGGQHNLQTKLASVFATARHLLAQESSPESAPTDQSAAPPADQTSGEGDQTQGNTEGATAEPPPETPPTEQPVSPDQGEIQTPSEVQTAPGDEESAATQQELIVAPDDITPPPENASIESPSAGELGGEAPRENAQSSPQASPALVSDLAALEENFNAISGISKETAEKSAIEDNQIEKAAAPETRSDLLLQFADEKIDDIEKTIQKDDFATTNFIAQRLNDQVDNFASTLGTLEPAEKEQFAAKIASFSDHAESMLRSQQLVVPEGLEQDLEIVRGKLLILGQ